MTMTTSNSVQTESALSWNSKRIALFGSPWIAVLAVLLLVQLGATALIYWPRNQAATAGEPLLTGYAADQVQGLTITDANGRTLHTIRKDDGWVLPDADEYPVKKEKVSGLLDKIGGLKRDRLVGTRSATLTQLKVADADFARRIELDMADGSHPTIYVGDGPRFRTSHVRLGGENKAYLSLDFPTSATATRMADWIDVSYFHVAEANVKKMTLENSNGVFNFYRDDQDAWQMEDLAEGEKFDSNNLVSLLTTLSSLNMVEPLGKEEKPEYGLDKPAAVVRLEYTDDAGKSKNAELRIGALDSTRNDYVASSSESPYFVHVAKYSVDRFVQRTRQEFLQQPPTPTPQS